MNRCYSGRHRFYCGVDLHARTMFVHVVDHKGQTVFEQDLPAGPEAFLRAIKPFRKDLVVGVECMFAWYWLADLCEAEGIPFALGHALAMRHIHKAKSKSDRIDAGKLAAMLRGGLFPLAYAYTGPQCFDSATTTPNSHTICVAPVSSGVRERGGFWRQGVVPPREAVADQAT
jgi:hypothetical protein